MSFINIEWKFSIKLFFLLLIIVMSIPFTGIGWFVFKFDLPFVHGGDTIIVKYFLFIWWIFALFFIWGWRTRR